MTTCNPDGPNGGPCGPLPCAGECKGEPDLCDLCDARADYRTEDLDTLCGNCTRELGAEVRYVLSEGDY